MVVGAGVALSAGGGAPAAAAAAPGGVTILPDQPYTTGPCGPVIRSQLLDAYLPQRVAAPTAAIVLVHGGGFVSGDKRDKPIVEIATDLARRGWAVLAINYCLPQGTPGFPVEVENTVAAVRYVAAHATALNIDPARVATWGDSAGSNLGMMAATQLGTADPRSPVAAAVGWSGPYDLAATPASHLELLTLLAIYLGCPPLDPSCRDTAAAASPINYVDGKTPPTFLANSTHESIPLSQLTQMAAALADAGVPHRTLTIPGSKHSVEYTDEAYCPSVRFLETYLGPTTGGPCRPPAVD